MSKEGELFTDITGGWGCGGGIEEGWQSSVGWREDGKGLDWLPPLSSTCFVALGRSFHL